MRCVSMLVLLAIAVLVVPSVHAQRRGRARASRATPVAVSLGDSLSDAAKADYEAAKLLASDGDFAGALIKFQSAYDASNDVRLLWNVAFCQKNLRRYAKVIATLQRYIADPSPLLTEQDRSDARDLIATIEPFTTRLTLRVNEDGAEISIDGETVGLSPFALPAVVDIGERRIRVAKAGFVPFERITPFGGSAEVALDVQLERELHEGRLLVTAPTTATVFLDDQSIGTGAVDRTVPSGGHQLRVTAPGMVTFQSEIVIQDRETRSVDVALQALPEAEKPKIRVSVGCGDSEPRGPEDGLVAYLDGPNVLQPAYVAKRWDADLERNVVVHVEYAVSPGPHTLRFRIPGCDSLAQTVNVDATRGAEITGALESDTFYLFRGTQGSPGHWRVGLNGWFPIGDVNNGVPAPYRQLSLGGVVGVTLTGAWLARWFGFSFDLSLGSGTFKRDGELLANYMLPDPANVTWKRALFRMGNRFPFHAVAFSLGGGVGIQELNLDKIRTGVPQGLVGIWTSLDWQPLCDWGLTLMGDVYLVPNKNDSAMTTDSAMTSGSDQGGPDISLSLQVGAFFQPNAQCTKERATQFGLRAAPR